MAEAWTRTDLIAWAADDIVFCLDLDTAPRPLPDWFDRPHPPAPQHSVGQRLAAAHPDDRQRMIDMWWEIMRTPGQPIELELVVNGEHGWVRVLTRFVNLVDQPDVRGRRRHHPLPRGGGGLRAAGRGPIR